MPAPLPGRAGGSSGSGDAHLHHRNTRPEQQMEETGIGKGDEIPHGHGLQEQLPPLQMHLRRPALPSIYILDFMDIHPKKEVNLIVPEETQVVCS